MGRSKAAKKGRALFGGCKNGGTYNGKKLHAATLRLRIGVKRLKLGVGFKVTPNSKVSKSKFTKFIDIIADVSRKDGGGLCKPFLKHSSPLLFRYSSQFLRSKWPPTTLQTVQTVHPETPLLPKLLGPLPKSFFFLGFAIAPYLKFIWVKITTDLQQVFFGGEKLESLRVGGRKWGKKVSVLNFI